MTLLAKTYWTKDFLGGVTGRRCHGLLQSAIEAKSMRYSKMLTVNQLLLELCPVTKPLATPKPIGRPTIKTS